MTDNSGERFTGHGSEWTDSNLSPEDAHVATVWVYQIVNCLIYTSEAADE